MCGQPQRQHGEGCSTASGDHEQRADQLFILERKISAQGDGDGTSTETDQLSDKAAGSRCPVSLSCQLASDAAAIASAGFCPSSGHRSGDCAHRGVRTTLKRAPCLCVSTAPFGQRHAVLVDGAFGFFASGFFRCAASNDQAQGLLITQLRGIFLEGI